MTISSAGPQPKTVMQQDRIKTELLLFYYYYCYSTERPADCSAVKSVACGVVWVGCTGRRMLRR